MLVSFPRKDKRLQTHAPGAIAHPSLVFCSRLDSGFDRRATRAVVAVLADQSTTIEAKQVADSSCSSVTAGERHTTTAAHLPNNTAAIAPNMRIVSALA